MNKFLIATLLSISTTAFADATLRIPMFSEGSKGQVTASELNQMLRKNRSPLRLEEYLVISDLDNAYNKVKEYDAQVLAAAKVLKTSWNRVTENIPGDNNTSALRTCYTGKAHEVTNIVADLTESAYSEQMSILGYKYKKDKTILAENYDNIEIYLNEESELWKNWRGTGQALLILTSYGDSGDDVNESLIPLCK